MNRREAFTIEEGNMTIKRNHVHLLRSRSRNRLE